ncbi:hypothetical protein PTKIN_Ptkin11bG0002500 [Pterospermum kingtungense]
MTIANLGDLSEFPQLRCNLASSSNPNVQSDAKGKDGEIIITSASDVYAEGDHWNKSVVAQLIGKFRNVPLELFTLRGLSYIASGIGNPLYMDRFTTNRELVPVYVETLQLPSKCSVCCVFSHSTKNCLKKVNDVAVQHKWVPKVNKTVTVEHDVNVVKKDSVGGNANVQGKASSVARFSILANEADEVISVSKPSTVTDLMNDIKAKVQDTMRKPEVDKRKVALAECVTAVTQDQSCSIKGSLSIDKSKGVIHEGEVMDEADETISDSDSEANLEKSNGRPKLPIASLVRPQRLAALRAAKAVEMVNSMNKKSRRQVKKQSASK